MVEFDKAIFNINNDFYAVDKRGIVMIVDIRMDLKSKVLLLLDPCEYLNNAQDQGPA